MTYLRPQNVTDETNDFCEYTDMRKVVRLPICFPSRLFHLTLHRVCIYALYLEHLELTCKAIIMHTKCTRKIPWHSLGQQLATITGPWLSSYGKFICSPQFETTHYAIHILPLHFKCHPSGRWRLNPLPMGMPSIATLHL